MNGEEDGPMEVTQESLPPPSVIEEQPPPETAQKTEKVDDVEQCESLDAATEPDVGIEEAKQPDVEHEVAPLEDEKVDGGEEGHEVGDSTCPVVIGGDEVTAVRDDAVVESEGKGEDEASLVAAAGKEDGLMGGFEGEIVEEKHDVEEDDGLKVGESLPAGEEGGEQGEGEAVEEQQQGAVDESVKVEEASPAGEASIGGKGQVDDTVEKLCEEKASPRVPESGPFGEDNEELDGDGEAQTDKKQDEELKVGEETAGADENMGGDREMEEADGSQVNGDGLLPVDMQEGEMMEEGKTQVLDTNTEVVKASEIELKEETKRMGEGEKMMEVEEEKEIKMEGEGEAKEDDEMKVENKELEGEEGKDVEEKEVDGDAEKGTEEEEEREVEAEEEKEMEEDEAPKTGSGKRKRGRNSKAVGRAPPPPRKTVGEDVCFICLDGGDLVLCDRRGCPKAYHPSCVDRDEAFFRSKGRWNCGWHLCRQCKKNAHYMCYTCQFSLCKGCLKDDAIIFCIRGNKGLCETCMKSVMLIENNEGNNGTDQATFDDKSSMDYLFKDYWNEQKEKLSLTSDEIEQAKIRWRRSKANDKQEVPAEILAGNTEGGAISDSSLGNAETTDSKRKKSKKRMRSANKVDYDTDGSAGKAEASGTRKRGRRRLKSQSKGVDFEVDSASHMASTNEGILAQGGTEWASKELLEFVMHMKNGDTSALSQFDVQELLLEYIKRNKLRDPRRRSQIICDAMLQKLFGKQRVAHFEMLKLLESHFLLKEDSQADDNQGSVVDAEGSQLDADENTDSLVDVGTYKGRKARKKGDRRGLQSNLDDYAAIDMHNINLIYLRRNLIEGLMEDSERFHEKVVGSFVRIRISGSSQKQDIYRLVQVIGTTKAAEPYKVGKRIADCMLEILNLNKTEVVSIDTISNQDFTEDECKRLRQSIKCGLISRLTVGDVLDKAKDLQAVRVIDWLETEITRLNHLRDRASDLGRKKELRECVEKLQLLSTPEERQRRLDEISEVHADPNMDPSHESEDESESEDKGQESNIRHREASFSWREREHFASQKGDTGSTDPWGSAAKPPSRKWEPSRSLSGKGFSSRHGDASIAEEALSGRPWSPVGDKVSPRSTASSEKLRTPDSSTSKLGQFSEPRSNLSGSASSESSRPLSASLVRNDVKISDTEKIWHYKDPTGKVQGPFSVTQLRKWNNNGYFPATLRIWRTSQSEDDSILLTEALAGRFEKEQPQLVGKPFETSQQTYRGQTTDVLKVDQNRGAGSTRNTDQLSPLIQRSQSDFTSKRFATPPSVDVPKYSSSDSPNLPSTSSQGTSPGLGGRTKASRWSGSPAPVQLPGSATGANGMLPSPTPDSSQVTRSSSSSSFERNRGFESSHMNQQSTRGREDERFGSGYSQKLSSQSTVAGGSPMVHAATHHTLQPTTDTATASTNNNSHGLSSNVAQPGNGQNPTASAHGWGSGAYIPRPEMMNPNLNNTNAMQGQGQGQQPAYSHWPTASSNTLPPPSYGAVLPASSGTFPAQNTSAMPSQGPWTSQVTAAQPNMQWVGMAAPENRVVSATQHPGNSTAGWAPMQANPQMGWGAPSGPPPAGQFGSQPGTVAGAAIMQTSAPAPSPQPGYNTMSWPVAGTMNPGWVAPPTNPGVPGPWNWQPTHGGSGMAPPGPQRTKGNTPCPFLMHGHCKKGANCDFRHN